MRFNTVAIAAIMASTMTSTTSNPYIKNYQPVRVITSGMIPHNARNNRKTKGKKK